jgi:hypothetical protein
MHSNKIVFLDLKANGLIQEEQMIQVKYPHAYQQYEITNEKG